MGSDVTVAIITALGGIVIAIVTGIFSSRAYVKKQFNAAENEAAARRKQGHDRATATRHLISCICRVLFWIVFSIDKAEVANNGERNKLDEAMENVNAAEQALKRIERDILENDE